MLVRALILIGILSCYLQAEIIVVVSEHSKLQQLTQNEVKQLFLNNRGGDTVAVEGSAADLQEQFYLKITGKTEAQLRAYRARQIFSGRGKPPRQVKPDELEAYLNDHPEAVSYMKASKLPEILKVVYRCP